MFEIGLLPAVNELENRVQVVEFLSVFEPATLKRGVWANTYVLICLEFNCSEERRQHTFHRDCKNVQNGSPNCNLFKTAVKLNKNN
jgi:hypothetical protein